MEHGPRFHVFDIGYMLIGTLLCIYWGAVHGLDIGVVTWVLATLAYLAGRGVPHD